MERWLLKWWLRFTLWLNPPAPMPDLPTALPVILPPSGFKSWFAWESVQFTQDPTAFWFNPYRYGDEPTAEEHREAQDRVAALFGLKVARDSQYVWDGTAQRWVNRRVAEHLSIGPTARERQQLAANAANLSMQNALLGIGYGTRRFGPP